MQDARLPVAAAVVQLCEEGCMGSAYVWGYFLIFFPGRFCEWINNVRYPRYCGVYGNKAGMKKGV